MKTWILVLFSCVQFLSLSAQTKINFTGGEPYDENRYEGTAGKAYLFDSWVNGVISGTDGVVYEPILMNYNGYEEEFEIFSDGKFIRLQEEGYSQVVLTGEDGEEVTFVRGVHADFRGRYIRLLYRGEKITLIQKFKVFMTENKVNTPGKTETLQRFKPQKTYFVVKGGESGEVMEIKTNKKKLIQALGHKKELETFMKKEKLNPSKENDLAKLIQYWEQLL